MITIIGLAMNDVLTLSPKFWGIHMDPLIVLDGAAMTLLNLGENSTRGTQRYRHCSLS